MAFRLIDKSLKFDIALYPRVERKLPTAKDKGWTKLEVFCYATKWTSFRSLDCRRMYVPVKPM